MELIPCQRKNRKDATFNMGRTPPQIRNNAPFVGITRDLIERLG